MLEDKIEKENYGDEIDVPFDPSKIKISNPPFTLGQLVDKIKYGEVNFHTPYQRKDNLWDPKKQSRLMESVILRLPLPSFYFDEVEPEDVSKGKSSVWNVIDGLQRCSVFKNYLVEGSMKLEGLEFLKQFEVTYKNLPSNIQRRIMMTPITIFVVERGTPEAVKFNIFKRINTGGLILNAQEIRHAMNQGVAADFVSELAAEPSFVKATCGVIKTKRMEDCDFVTRFVSFYLIPYTQYRPDMDSFMTDGMAMIKKTTSEGRLKMKKRFIKSMNLAMSLFGNDAFRKRKDICDRRRPINKPLFEVLSVSFAKLNDEEQSCLKTRANAFKNKFIALNNTDAFWNSLTSGTSNKENVRRRFEDINRIIKETIE